MASPGPSDAALLSDRLDPAESFSAFYRRYSRDILSFCASQGLSAHDAADLTSDVFIVALTARYKFDAKRGEEARPWLFTIAANLVAGTHRRNRRERAAHERLRQGPIVLTERDLADYAELREEVDSALGHIAELPPEQRAAIVGRHVADVEYHEIARQEGVSEQVVRQRVSRALTTVRERMGSRS